MNTSIGSGGEAQPLRGKERFRAIPMVKTELSAGWAMVYEGGFAPAP